MNLLTYTEVGERLGVSRKVAANLARAGHLPRVILSPRKHRVLAEDVDAYIEQHMERAS